MSAIGVTAVITQRSKLSSGDGIDLDQCKTAYIMSDEGADLASYIKAQK